MPFVPVQCKICDCNTIINGISITPNGSCIGEVKFDLGCGHHFVNNDIKKTIEKHDWNNLEGLFIQDIDYYPRKKLNVTYRDEVLNAKYYGEIKEGVIDVELIYVFLKEIKEGDTYQTKTNC